MIVIFSCLFYFLLLQGSAVGFNHGKEVFHFPRNLRPRTPFGGIRDILSYSPLGSDEKGKRSCSHDVNLDGFNLSYNVTIVKGVFNIDDDERVLHINCEFDENLMQIEIMTSDPQSLMEELSNSSYIVGDHSWGCVSGKYNDSVAEPIYKKILNVSHIVPENNSVIVNTALASFVQLFEKSSIRLDISPNFVTPFDNHDGENSLHTIESQKDLTTIYPGQKSFQFSYNYDADRKVAKTNRIKLNSLVTCEECFYNFNPGFTFNLDIELSSYYIPYAQNLEMSFYGSGVLSAYMRMTTPQSGVSPEYALTEKVQLSVITLYIFAIPFIIYPSFQMFAQYNITDASLPITLFGGFTGTATNVKYGYITSAGGTSSTIISGSNFTFKGTPLSSYYDKSKALSGSFQPRLYLIPRVYLSPYGLVDFAIDVKPYLGVALWTSGLGLPKNPYSPSLTVDQFNALTVPSQPSAPTIAAVTQNSALITIPLPNTADSSIYFYEVRIKSTSIFSYFSDYVTLSELGYFQVAYVPTCFSVSYYASKTLAAPYNTPIQCSQLCYGDGACNAYILSSASSNCYLYNISSNLLTTSGCAFNYLYRSQYKIRDSDPFGYTVSNNVATAQTISFLLASHSFYVSYRALNQKGFSSWSADSIAQLSISARLSYSGGGCITLLVTVANNLKVGETVTVGIYQYGTLSTPLLTTQYLTISSSSTSLSLLIGNYYATPYKAYGSNSIQIYATVSYPSSNEVYSGYYSTTTYYPVVIPLYSFKPTYAYFQFYANINQISKVRLHLSYCSAYFLGFCSTTTSADASQATSALCTNSFCTWTINFNFVSGITYTLDFYATDTANYEVRIMEYFYTPTSRRTMTHEMIDINGSSETYGLTNDFKVVEETLLHQEESRMDLSNNIVVIQNEEHEEQIHLDTDISWLQGYTYCAPSTANGLNYAFFYGVDVTISMQAISVLGFVLFPAWQSRTYALIKPTIFSDLIYATGCIALPQILPSVVVKSPISSDKWGLTTEMHHIAWDYYSISQNATVSICLFSSTFEEVNCIDEYSIDSAYPLYLDPNVFEIDTQYYVKVSYSSTVYGLSDLFTVVSPEDDPSISKIVTMWNQSFDDSFKSVGTIFHPFRTISIVSLPGTRCQSKYKNYPLNVYCLVNLALNVSNSLIYNFSLNIGFSVEDEVKLRSNEFGINYGINFPAFVFPSTLVSDYSLISYFLRSLAGKKLTDRATFPNDDEGSSAQVLSTPGGDVCLSSLLSHIADASADYDSCSDINAAAEKVNKFINLLGMDACLQINLVNVDIAKGGVKFKAILNTTIFDSTKVDWSEYLPQKSSNRYMQLFLSASGTSTSSAVSYLFQKMLKILHIPSIITMSTDFGSFASSLFSSKLTGKSSKWETTSSSETRPSFLDSTGNFLLGSSATGLSLAGNPTMSPTNVPTFVPSIAPTMFPTAAPSNSVTPSAAPTIKPSSYPSTMPTLFPTATPSNSVTPSAVPTIKPSSFPSKMPTVFPTLPSNSSSPPLADGSGPIASNPSQSPSIDPSKSSSTLLPSCLPTFLPTSNPTDTTALPSGEMSLIPSLSSSKRPTLSPSSKSLQPTGAPHTSSPTSKELQDVSIRASQSISGITVSQYFSSKNYSLALRSSIASCLSSVSPSDIHILNVSSLQSSGRRLNTASNSVGIVAAYLLSVKSQYSQSALQQQLVSASTSGLFTSQLKVFSSHYSTPAFQNVTSLGVTVFTTPPSAAPTTSSGSLVPPASSSSGQSNFLLIYIIIAAVVLLVAISIAIYYIISMRKRAASIAATQQPAIDPSTHMSLEDIYVNGRI